MKVAYITVGENITTPLLRRQLIEMIIEMKRSSQDLHIMLVSFFFPSNLISYRREIWEVRRTLRSEGVGTLFLPLLVPWPFPYFLFKKTDVGWRPKIVWTPGSTRWLLVEVLPVLTFLLFIFGIRVFHCRSYSPAYCVVQMKRLFHRIKVVFDPRSDFPEENVTAGIWGESSKAFAFWKRSEKAILENSEAIACIADTYRNHYMKVAPNANYFHAPNNVNTEKFYRSESERKRLRHALKVVNDELLFCYVGAMTSQGWHRASIYAHVVKQFRTLSLRHSFLFLVPFCSREVLMKELEAANALDQCIIIHPSYDEVPAYLSVADVGLMYLHRSKIAVGTKIGEYAASGLPTITNSNCLGAVELVTKHGIGTVVDLGVGDLDTLTEPNFNLLVQRLKHIEIWGQEVRVFAEEYFSNGNIARTYLNKYNEIIG